MLLAPWVAALALFVPQDPAPEADEHDHEAVELSEEVVVTATRSGQRLQDQALRVEVLGQEEIEEKLLMTPGDVAMLLNETGGLRVQVSSPSLGAASVRVQGLRGRYTQILADGLPLYGGEAGALGILQIPPMDLGQVEVIKGAASALYGATALGGVINFVSRQPPHDGNERELLVNRTTRGGTDGVMWAAGTPRDTLGLSLLAGVHHQQRHDVDDDGWADLAGFTRVLARPRLSFQGESGRTVFVTVGAMGEDRRGGTLDGARVPDGTSFEEALDTRRFDGGLIARIPVGSTRLLSVRASMESQRHLHRFGPVEENDRHRTALGEVSLSATAGRHTMVAGAALLYEGYRNTEVGRFDDSEVVPGLFVQDDFRATASVTLSASARLDHASDVGTFLSPRGSVFWRPGPWSLRASAGSGFRTPDPFTDETETVGLSRLRPLGDLDAERAVTGSLDVGRTLGRVEVHGTVFGSRVSSPLAVRELQGGGLDLVNAPGPVRTAGSELLGRLRWRAFVATGTWTWIRSTEIDLGTGLRDEVPLTPRHALGFVAAWERHGRGRVGAEVYYTGRQRLDDNPFRSESRPYVVVGALGEWRFGRARVFLNLENLTDARQTKWDPLVRPDPGLGGRWTVDAWSPLEGRTINGGVRLEL